MAIGPDKIFIPPSFLSRRITSNPSRDMRKLYPAPSLLVSVITKTCKQRLLPSLALLGLIIPASALAIVWNPEGDLSNLVGGSGDWDTTTENWRNQTGFPNVAWTDDGNATFSVGGGTVNLTEEINAMSVHIDADGHYFFTGSKLRADDISVVSTDATISSQFSTGTITLGDNATLTLGGGANMTPGANSLGHLQGQTPTSFGTLQIVGGYWSAATTYRGVIDQSGGTVELGSSTIIGDDGFQYADGYWTLSEPGASLIDDASYGFDTIILGRNGATGVLTVEEGLVQTDRIYVAFGDNSTGTLWIRGGTVDVGNTLVLADSIGQNATLRIEDGVTTLKEIDFGRGQFFGEPASASVALEGGSLYIGSGGIANTSSGPGLAVDVTLSGGVLGADEAWSSSVDMTILQAKVDEALYFKAANEAGDARNIALSGNLSGTGDLLKTGDGVLTLSGTNSYLGDTEVLEGELVVAASDALGAGDLTVAPDAILTLQTPDSLDDSLFLSLASTSIVNLDFVGIDTIGGLSLDEGWSLAPAGIYGALSSGADYEFAMFQGTGFLHVVPEPAATTALIGVCAIALALITRRRVAVSSHS